MAVGTLYNDSTAYIARPATPPQVTVHTDEVTHAIPELVLDCHADAGCLHEDRIAMGGRLGVVQTRRLVLIYNNTLFV
jgi:hypothetical protein